jgi:hypothetical protein
MSFFSGIGRALKKVWKSPIGKVIVLAAGAYVAVPAVSKAFEAYGSTGSFGSAIAGAGEGAWGAIKGAGSAVGDVFTGGGGGAPVADAVGQNGMTSAPIIENGQQVRAPIYDGSGPKAPGGNGGGGIMSGVMNFLGSPGGAAALKLVGGALSPNETAMRINAEDK